MLVHKNQARKHLKRDVPNLVLREHLILSMAARRRRKKRKTEGKKKERFQGGKNAVKRCSRRFCSGCVDAKSLFWKSEALKCSIRTSGRQETACNELKTVFVRAFARFKAHRNSSQRFESCTAQPVSHTRENTAQPTVFVNERQAL